MTELTLFISHRGSDVELAREITRLFEKALKLPARQIRCTSVDGYRLPVGADTDEQLRREVFDAQAFIGLISPAAVESPYVMFELGARWGAHRHLAPVLARGADSTYLGGPLSGINALRLTERNQVIQLVEDIAEYLHLPLEPGASYQEAIDAVVAAASKPATQTRAAKWEEPIELQDTEIQILQFIAHNPGQKALHVAAETKLPLERAKYHVQRLIEAGMLQVATHDLMTGEVWYSIQQSGRSFLVQRGLL